MRNLKVIAERNNEPRRGKLISYEEIKEIDIVDLEEVLSTRMGDLIVLDKGFSLGFDVLVCFKEMIAVNKYFNTFKICSSITSGKDYIESNRRGKL